MNDIILKLLEIGHTLPMECRAMKNPLEAVDTRCDEIIEVAKSLMEGSK